MAQLITVTFLRKVDFVVLLTAYVLVIENQTVMEGCNTTIVSLQSSHLLQGLRLAKLLLTATLTELPTYSLTLARRVGPEAPVNLPLLLPALVKLSAC